MSDPSVVMLDWLDSSGFSGTWTDRAEVERTGTDPLRCKSVGFLVHETDDVLVVAQSLSPDMYGHPLTIPKVAVTGRRIVKTGASK